MSTTAMLAAMLALDWVLRDVLGVGRLRGGWEVLAFGWMLAAKAASWIPFAWWVRRRRGVYRRRVREGTLHEGRVVEVRQDSDRSGRYPFVAVEVTLGQGSGRFGVRYPGHRGRPAVGDPEFLLHHPEVKHAAAFRDGQTGFDLLV